MSKLDADKHIRSGVPGVYHFNLNQYDQVQEFLHDFRRYEGLCRAKGYAFSPSLNRVEEPPFDAFDVTIRPTGLDRPYIAHSRKAISRKLPRM